MATNKKYWKSLDELQDVNLTERLASKEFAEEIPVGDFLNNDQTEKNDTSRRDFLKLVGFSTAAATLAACEAPVIKSVPYLVKPNEITPGVPTYYASTLFNGYDYANVIVKNREGRPIKIDPNRSAEYFGSTNARAQASVLSLYDSEKYNGPKIDGKDVEWSEVDALVTAKLSAVAGKKIILLTSSLPSPSTKKIITEFKAKYPTTEHVIYDAISYSAALDAAEEVYGKRTLPHYDLSKTQLVVSFAADFLGDWFAGDLDSSYAKAKAPGIDMLRHIQVEANMSITGANSDTRIPAKPSEINKMLAEVYTALTGGTATSKEAKEIAVELKAAGSKAVVFADGDKNSYKLSYLINQILASSAFTGKALLLKESNDSKYQQFLAEAEAGQVAALITFQANPVYNSKDGAKLAKAIKDKKIEFTVSTASKEDETAEFMQVIAPSTDWLESWGDISPLTGVYSLMQPVIQKLFKSRQFQDSLLTWTGNTTAYADYLPNFYKGKLGDFDKALYNGYTSIGGNTNFSASGSGADAVAALSATKKGAFEMQLYTKPSMGDGTLGNNPWLQELPDGISRCSWDNYATMALADAEDLGIETYHGSNEINGRMQYNGNYVNVTTNGVTLKLPVFIQPGQAIGTLGLALGYGRTNGGKVANDVGVNAYTVYNGSIFNSDVAIELTSGTHEFACMQAQGTLMGRYSIARDVKLADYLEEGTEDEWNPQPTMGTHRGVISTDKVDLWAEHDSSVGHHFNLSIDMNLCTGCGACIIACQAENNVAVVGKEEIRMSRDMYWLRIDRYYASDMPPGADTDGDGKLSQKEAIHDDYTEQQISGQYAYLVKPMALNPEVLFQPMLCQHCNHASCETVCPVAATSHGKQGQNMMAYNRCVGTRYCANNCPYKVRRFNWKNYAQNDEFDYHMNDDLGRMVLNPDVAVRSRGVMEKCSMCIQSTQYIIAQAKREEKVITDDQFIDACACAAACSSGAMIFGDINDSSSTVVKLKKGKRKYEVLQDLGMKPNVFYHVKVRNKK